MPKRIWVGVVELRYTTAAAPEREKRAFTNISTWADDYDEFCAKSKEMVENYGWQLLGIEQADPVAEGQEFGSEIRDMIERTKANPSAVLYGTFHNYPAK